MSGFELQEAATWPPQVPAGAIPHDKWSPLECWVWEKLQTGAIANIDKYRDDSADPRKPGNWRDGRRRLTPGFIADLLLREPYCSSLHRKGVRIVGAWFDDSIDLEWAEVTRPILLGRCRFEKPVRLEGFRTPRSVSFKASAFTASLELRLS